MMRALKIDESTNDLVFGNGVFQWVMDEEELLQEIRSVLKTNVMEWFLDPTHGTNHSVMRGKTVSEDEVIQAVNDALEQVDRITSVDEINVEFDRRERKLTVSFRATAGEFEISEVIEF